VNHTVSVRWREEPDLGRDPRPGGPSRPELAPDQQLILGWQRLAGNAAVCQALAHPPVVQRAKPEPMRPLKTAYKTLPAAVQKVLSESDYRRWVADESDGPGVRVTLVGAHKLLSKQGDAWRFISTIQWVGMGTMDVTVSPSPQAFKRHMEAQGFASTWFAAAGSDLWGLRKTVEGVGIHIRGQPRDVVNIHVDLHPPKLSAASAAWHWVMDKQLRGYTVTPKTLKRALGLEREL
jgi:hypothetical protein